MSQGGNAVRRLPARGHQQLLATLEDARQRRVGGDDSIRLPRLTLLLEAGHTLTGEFLRFATELPVGGPMVLIRDEAHGSDLDVSYVPLSRIHALRVHFDHENLHLLGFDVVHPSAGPAPGRLELQRRVRDLGEFLSERVGHDLPVEFAWDELPRSEDAMASIARLLADLRGALERVTGDALGAQALGERVELVRVVASDSAGATLASRALIIAVFPHDGDLQTLAEPQLTSAIEELL